MNKETYEALKRVIEGTKNNTDIEMEDLVKVESWIDEVAKEYIEE